MIALIFVSLIALLLWMHLSKEVAFSVANFFKDDSGKESMVRLGTFIALLATTGGLLYIVTNETDTQLIVSVFTLYTLTWAATKPAEMLITLGIEIVRSRSGLPPAASRPFPPLDEDAPKS